MAQALEFLNRYADTIDEMVNITSDNIMNRSDFLSQYMPFREYSSNRLIVLASKMQNAIAAVVAPDADIPTWKAGSMQVDTNQMIKLVKSYVYGEEDLETMHEWSNRLGDIPTDVLDHYYGSVTDLPDAVADLHTLLTVEAMSTGRIAYTDLVTEAPLEMQFQTSTNNFPAALTGNAVWTDAANATPLADLREHSRLLRNVVNVSTPAALQMNSNTYGQMIGTDEFKRSAVAHLGLSTDSANIASYEIQIETVQQMLNKLPNRLPELQIVDDKYVIPNANGDGFDEEFFIKDGTYQFAWENQGTRALGPVASNNFQSGIFVELEEFETKHPRRDRAIAVAKGIPAFFDVRKMAGRQVYAA